MRNMSLELHAFSCVTAKCQVRLELICSMDPRLRTTTVHSETALPRLRQQQRLFTSGRPMLAAQATRLLSPSDFHPATAEQDPEIHAMTEHGQHNPAVFLHFYSPLISFSLLCNAPLIEDPRCS